MEDLCEEDGLAHMGKLGNLLLKKQPDFDPRNYGFSKLSKLIRALDRFQIVPQGEENVEYYVRDICADKSQIGLKNSAFRSGTRCFLCVMVALALGDQESQRDQNSQSLGGNHRPPDAVQAPEQRQQQDHPAPQQQSAGKGDEGGNKAVT